MAEYIEREALYEKAYWHGEQPDVFNPYADGVEAVDIVDVDAIPAADVAPVVHGRWKKHIDQDEFWDSMEFEKCSICGTLHYCAYNYCPNCGAKMDLEGTSND
ncbi:MAG: hypothetical protein IKW44_05055 [Bacteroidaceae bacterium]|nr:hypothetical protein [Bacteroidaceae bacterium]